MLEAPRDHDFSSRIGLVYIHTRLPSNVHFCPTVKIDYVELAAMCIVVPIKRSSHHNWTCWTRWDWWWTARMSRVKHHALRRPPQAQQPCDNTQLAWFVDEELYRCHKSKRKSIHGRWEHGRLFSAFLNRYKLAPVIRKTAAALVQPTGRRSPSCPVLNYYSLPFNTR